MSVEFGESSSWLDDLIYKLIVAQEQAYKLKAHLDAVYKHPATVQYTRNTETGEINHE